MSSRAAILKKHKSKVLQNMARDQVFISYSHKDKDWLERLQTMLVPLARAGLKIWADTDIKPGEEWKAVIEQALTRTKVAVLLVSPDFLASRFIHENELPPLLNAVKNEGLTILWVPVRPSLYEDSAIEKYHAAYDPETPLSTLSKAQQEIALTKIARTIIKSTRPPPTMPISELVPDKSPPPTLWKLLSRKSLLMVGVVLIILSGTGLLYYVGYKWSVQSPSLQSPSVQPSSVQPPSVLTPQDSWFFRGTSNYWGKAQMEQVDKSDVFKKTVCFARQDPNPRFKIDHFGDWQETYPAQEIALEDCSCYDITFNRTTKAIDKNRITKVTNDRCAE